MLIVSENIDDDTYQNITISAYKDTVYGVDFSVVVFLICLFV